MKPLTLALMGLEPQDAETFHDAFRHLPQNQADKWRVLDDDSDAAADLTIVDIDSIYGHMDWLKATSSGSRTAVFTTAHNPQESDLVLGKPLRTKQLVEVLAQVIAEQDGTVSATDTAEASVSEAVTSDAVAPGAGATADVEANAAGAESVSDVVARRPARDSQPRPRTATTRVEARRRPPAQPKPVAESVAESEPPSTEPQAVAEPPPPVLASLGEWLRAGEPKKPRRIHASGQEWILDPEHDAYFGPTGLKPLVAALGDPPDSAEPVDTVTLEAARKQPPQALSRLRWVAGMHASPGHLLPELQQARSFQLARWPQIEREYPRHFRIATAMMKQAGDLDSIVAASGAPRVDVIDFINAYHTLGFVKVEGGPEPEAESQRGRVMSRFRKPFGR